MVFVKMKFRIFEIRYFNRHSFLTKQYAKIVKIPFYGRKLFTNARFLSIIVDLNEKIERNLRIYCNYEGN